MFCTDSYVEDTKSICWSDVCNEEHPDAAPDAVIDKHAPIQKQTFRTVKALWIDEELKSCMVGREKRSGE